MFSLEATAKYIFTHERSFVRSRQSIGPERIQNASTTRRRHPNNFIILLMELSSVLKKGNTMDGWKAQSQGTMFIPCDNAEKDHVNEPYIDEPFARSQFDLPDGPLLRFQAYRKSWQKCLCKIKEIARSLHNPVVDAVVESVQAAYTFSGRQVVLPSPELVTLLVSSPDRTNLHDVLARISSNLRSEEECQDETDRIPGAFISCLSELDCVNVTVAMKSLIGGFISQTLGDTIAPKMTRSSSLAAYDMNLLKAWYEMAKEKYGTNVPVLVVLVHDLQTIDTVIIRDVLEICSLYVSHLPLVFILGTPDPEILHSALPRSVLACLRIDKFVLPWSMKALENIIRETFFSLKFDPDVMLGPAGCETIFREFRRNNATLDAVLSTLQLLHIQHFYNPLSLVIDPGSEAILCEVHDNPPEDWIPWLKLVRQYCISAPIDATRQTDYSEWLEIMPRDVIKTLLGTRATFNLRANRMKLAIKVFETVLTFARGRGTKISAMCFENIGVEALRGSLGSNHASELSNVMKQSSLEEIRALMEELYHLLHNLPSSAREGAAMLKPKVVYIKNHTTQEAVNEFATFLESYFKESLIPFEDVPCLDIWWTGDMDVPHSPLNPNPRVAIVTALGEPQEYLGWNTSSKPREHWKLSSLPDVCILFRRYVESGKMINVYDWYESFSVALENETLVRDEDHMMGIDDESPSKGKGKITLKRKERGDQREQEVGEVRKREIQARFMRGMHELDFVGFLKHTGRKVDHVAKTALDVLRPDADA